MCPNRRLNIVDTAVSAFDWNDGAASKVWLTLSTPINHFVTRPWASVCFSLPADTGWQMESNQYCRTEDWSHPTQNRPWHERRVLPPSLNCLMRRTDAPQRWTIIEYFKRWKITIERLWFNSLSNKVDLSQLGDIFSTCASLQCQTQTRFLELFVWQENDRTRSTAKVTFDTSQMPHQPFSWSYWQSNFIVSHSLLMVSRSCAETAPAEQVEDRAAASRLCEDSH